MHSLSKLGTLPHRALSVRPQGQALAAVLTCVWQVRKPCHSSSVQSQNLAAHGRGFGLSSEVTGALSVSRLGPLLSTDLGDPDTCFLSPWQAHGSGVPQERPAPRLQGRGSRSHARLCSRRRRPAGFQRIYQCLCMFFLCGI